MQKYKNTQKCKKSNSFILRVFGGLRNISEMFLINLPPDLININGGF